MEKITVSALKKYHLNKIEMVQNEIQILLGRSELTSKQKKSKKQVLTRKIKNSYSAIQLIKGINGNTELIGIDKNNLGDISECTYKYYIFDDKMKKSPKEVVDFKKCKLSYEHKSVVSKDQPKIVINDLLKLNSKLDITTRDLKVYRVMKKQFKVFITLFVNDRSRISNSMELVQWLENNASLVYTY